MVAHALMSISPDFYLGYDIGCAFSKTLAKSELAPYAKGVRCVCGVFDSYAHHRACQLRYNPRFVPGAGLEDFEGNERLFSETNRLGGSTRQAAKYTRHARIEQQIEAHNQVALESICRFASVNRFELINIVLQAAC